MAVKEGDQVAFLDGDGRLRQTQSAQKTSDGAQRAVGQPVVVCDRAAGLFGLDPRTHLAAVLFVGAAAIVAPSLWQMVALQGLAAVYLVGNGHTRLAVRASASFVVVTGLSFLPLSGLYGVLFVSLIHLVPPFTTACSLFALSPSAIMCALSRWRVPKRILIGVCMAFRFASVLAFEAKSIMQGIRMRGIFPRAIDAVLHPALAYECLYTPLVMRCLRLSAELAASSELRGIDVAGARSSLHHVGFLWRDAAAVVAVAAACAAICLAREVM